MRGLLNSPTPTSAYSRLAFVHGVLRDVSVEDMVEDLLKVGLVKEELEVLDRRE